MNQRLTYKEMCREAATAQGLDPITKRLAAENITHSIEQTGGFVMVVSIPLAEPAWIGVTASDEQPGAWFVVLDHDNEPGEDTALSRMGSYNWPADEAVAAIQAHRAHTASHYAARAARRLVNASIVYCYPDGRGGTYTRLGDGAWGRPEEALDYAQRQRDAYHGRHGTTPITEVPWHQVGGFSGRPVTHDPPSTAVGIDIHDVRTDERWFVPTLGPPLGPTGPRGRTSDPLPSQATPEDGIDVKADEPTDEQPPRHPEPALQEKVDHLRQRFDSLAGTDPPDLAL